MAVLPTARFVGLARMLGGIALYVIYRRVEETPGRRSPVSMYSQTSRLSRPIDEIVPPVPIRATRPFRDSVM
jgi:hypothetical protein